MKGLSCTDCAEDKDDISLCVGEGVCGNLSSLWFDYEATTLNGKASSGNHYLRVSDIRNDGRETTCRRTSPKIQTFPAANSESYMNDPWEARAVTPAFMEEVKDSLI